MLSSIIFGSRLPRKCNGKAFDKHPYSLLHCRRHSLDIGGHRYANGF
jgi:hypothetical protein